MNPRGSRSVLLSLAVVLALSGAAVGAPPIE